MNEEKAYLLPLVSKAHQPALIRAIEFEQNPTEQNANAVAEVMNELFEIKQHMKQRDDVIKQLDDVIKFAVRGTAKYASTRHFFDVKPSRKFGKITNSPEMLYRLLQIFDNPMDFSSCIEFNYNNLKALMGDKFIKDNADIISETEYASAVFLQKYIDD